MSKKKNKKVKTPVREFYYGSDKRENVLQITRKNSKYKLKDIIYYGQEEAYKIVTKKVMTYLLEEGKIEKEIHYHLARV